MRVAVEKKRILTADNLSERMLTAFAVKGKPLCVPSGDYA
jgi:hypothetical protein